MIEITGKKQKVTVFGIVNTILLVLFGVICLFPLVYELLISVASKVDYYQSNFITIPRHFTIENFKFIFVQSNIGRSFLISMFTTVAGTIYNMVLTIIGSYALSREDMPFKKVFFFFVLFTMFFGGGLVPFYLVVKSLGLLTYNATSILSVVIPFGISGFNMIILRNFFRAVPEEILEACEIDGASQLRILVQFILPLSKAGLATVALFYAVERWNDWYWPMLFITNADYAPLSLALRNILSANTALDSVGGVDSTITFAEGQSAAAILVAIIPIVCVYPFVQKYFVQGVMLGGVKS